MQDRRDAGPAGRGAIAARTSHGSRDYSPRTCFITSAAKSSCFFSMPAPTS